MLSPYITYRLPNLMERMALSDHVVTQCRATADEYERDEPDNPDGDERT